MTLIIAGYNHEKSIDFKKFADSPVPPYTPSMDLNGLFVVADSAITSHSGGRTLLNGFKKVYTIEAKLWKPYFMPDGSFRDYNEVYDKNQGFVAFSGSTLTAQHIINSITAHLESLRISYNPKSFGEPIEYNVVRHCQRNPLKTDSITYWDDYTFLNRDFEGLLTGDVISDCIEYSINEALRSAGRYKLSIEEFRDMHTELVSGFWCPVKKRHELYVYRMLSKQGEDGVLVAYTEKILVPSNEVAVLGMRKEFELRAQNEFNSAMADFESPAERLHAFLDLAINEVQDNGSKQIDRPTSFRKLKNGRIKRIQ
ncbi:hypothetical protein [Pseudomonas aeruginosa]|uniref:hypothetical protein n=1 Tax=Pseudomonas aeruginosa TaxID=287 RepID=UPI001144FADE|nr:hypothetical protein [Pseudomonas aeruginosa]MBA5359998.1 hypothetical protein [Pseudomonas aeruginosa]MBH4516411.1 hypothetical protein [Pseudomonas aeruginosa]MBX6663427.1 hypothetical protein [Pseudomonas aeruginosa]MCB5969368.1 hypothetical protein [Pseudomonas aeruginosa]MCC0561606.1 hypothetical protein [Pseudomonas aeruginosa]